jgi:pimeloyl-ACP methyl ester carboxylesterase
MDDPANPPSRPLGDLARRALPAAAVLLAAGLTAGCVAPLGSLMVTTPNRFNPLVGPRNPLPTAEALAGADETFQVEVGPPLASLAVSVVEPKPPHAMPKGTVLVLHGVYARSLWMMGKARRLAEAGYRAVLVDLRGHGRSTGEYLTYGVGEARDLAQVIDELQRRGLLSGKLGVYGISYGATTSIHLAGLDPRIEAVVAVAPFSTMRDEVPHYGRTMVPGVGKAISEETYQEAIDEAGRLAGFDPDDADAAAALRRTKAPVLILHGDDDWVVPDRHGRRLRDAAPDRVELVSLPGLGHKSIWADSQGEVARRSTAWFDRHLASP